MAHPVEKSLFEENCDKETVYLHEVLRLALKRAGRSHGLSRDQVCEMVEAAFPESALTPENLRHLVTDRAATFTNPLALVSVMACLGESEMLVRMARFAGFLLVPTSEIEGTEAGLLAAAAAYQLDVAETQLEVARALVDGAMTPDRATHILREITDDEVKLAGLKMSVKAALSHWGKCHAADA